MATRIAKSLVPPDQGYPHREHRSKKGRNLANSPYYKMRRNFFKRMNEESRLRDLDDELKNALIQS